MIMYRGVQLKTERTRNKKYVFEDKLTKEIKFKFHPSWQVNDGWMARGRAMVTILLDIRNRNMRRRRLNNTSGCTTIAT